MTDYFKHFYMSQDIKACYDKHGANGVDLYFEKYNRELDGFYRFGSFVGKTIFPFSALKPCFSHHHCWLQGNPLSSVNFSRMSFQKVFLTPFLSPNFVSRFILPTTGTFSWTRTRYKVSNITLSISLIKRNQATVKYGRETDDF